MHAPPKLDLPEEAPLTGEPEQTNWRVIALLFLVTGVTASVAAALIPTLVSGENAPQAQHEGALLAGLVIGTVAWLWFSVNRCLLRPIERLASETHHLTGHGPAILRIDADDYPDISPLPEAVNALAEQLDIARRDIEHARAKAEAESAETSTRLSAILQDLHEGVLVCTIRHHVTLHNRAAYELLQPKHAGGTPELRPGTALISVMLVDPVRHTLERLIRQAGIQAGYADSDAGRFIGGTPDGRIMLDGRMSLVFHDGVIKGAGPVINNCTVTGYVLTFTDATRELAALGRRDALLRATTEDLRTPLGNLRAVMETLDTCPDLEIGQLRAFEEAMRTECATLTRHLEQIGEQYRATITGSWPMNDLRSLTLIELVCHRVSVHRGVTLTPTGIPCRLHGDSFSLAVLIDHLIERITKTNGATEFDLSAEPAARWIYLDLIWTGAAIPGSIIEHWKADPLPATLGGLTVGDVLRHHRSDFWSESRPDGRARLRLPLPPALGNLAPTVKTAPRRAIPVEAIDFTVLKSELDDTPGLSTPLGTLTYVVFDTETTGPDPANTAPCNPAPANPDKIIAIAAVRIANRRILIGEPFQTLVNPDRPIPPEATDRHGISDQQVSDQPGIDAVLPTFKGFAGGAVLVSHHAALDLPLLRAGAADGGGLPNPVIDTSLISMMLQGREADHSLDGLASQLGISAIDRHTALGDSLITAAVLLAQIDLLRHRDIVTLGDLLRAVNTFIGTQTTERSP